jgi:4-hydroxy-2-oxoheptanedioate aldolase
MKNILKEKMERGVPVLGTFFELGSATAVECLGLAGLDFLIIDTEHGPFEVESTMDFVRAAILRGIDPMVRVKDHTRASILKMLDIGATGLIIPCVETVEQVKKIVEYGKFYPLGRRGVAMTRDGGFGFDEHASGNINEYFRIANNETLIIPQCETKGCLDNIEEIASIEGVDGIFIGPYDLSIALGKPAQFSDLEFTAAIDRILKACKDAGKFAFIYGNSVDASKKYFKDGFNGVAFEMDVISLIKAYKSLICQIIGK